MQFLILFLALIGFGLFLGLAYVGLKALFMGTRGSVWFAKGLGSSMKQGWQQAKAEAEAKKQERLRARS